MQYEDSKLFYALGLDDPIGSAQISNMDSEKWNIQLTVGPVDLNVRRANSWNWVSSTDKYVKLKVES